MRKHTSLIDRVKRVVVAATAACMVAVPLPALAAATETDDVAIQAAATFDISKAEVFTESSYPYNGRPVEPDPDVYVDLEYAYSNRWIDIDFDRYWSSSIYDDIFGYEYDWDLDGYYDEDDLEALMLLGLLASSDTSSNPNISAAAHGFRYSDIDDIYDFGSYGYFEDWIDDYYTYYDDIIIDPYDHSGYVYLLERGIDYTIDYADNNKVGTGIMYINGKGDFYGTKTVRFTIGQGSGSTTGKAERLYGDTRYDTMAAIAEEGFYSANTAIVACGGSFQDALIASSLAGVYNAPVILTVTDNLSYQASNQLTRLGTNYVYVVGNTSAVSTNVENQIRNMGITVNRVSGSSYSDTSVEVMKTVRNVGSSSDTVIIATSNVFADSLSIGPVSYRRGAPIILTESNGKLSTAAVKAIKDDRNVRTVIIAGGPNSVSDDVKDQLGSSYAYIRLSGDTRYETSEEIAKWATNGGDADYGLPCVATGKTFPDALAGAALAGSTHSVLLLIDSGTDATASFLSANRNYIDSFYVLGGPSSVPDSLVRTLESYVG